MGATLGNKKQAKEYYKSSKERLQEEAQNKYRKSPNEGRNRKKEYGRNQFRNTLEVDKEFTKRENNFIFLLYAA